MSTTETVTETVTVIIAIRCVILGTKVLSNLFILSQKHIIEGVVAGAVKG